MTDKDTETLQDWLIDQNVTQITRLWHSDDDGLQITTGYTIVSGNNRYHGATILEALAQINEGKE